LGLLFVSPCFHVEKKIARKNLGWLTEVDGEKSRSRRNILKIEFNLGFK
jgi:hypothetical protein